MGINAMWIGSNDKHREGTMVWVSDKTNVSKGFSNWYPGEPNNLRRFEHCVHIWCIGYSDVPFKRYIYLVILYLSPSRNKILRKIEHESLCVDCVLAFIVTFKRITTVGWLTYPIVNSNYITLTDNVCLTSMYGSQKGVMIVGHVIEPELFYNIFVYILW